MAEENMLIVEWNIVNFSCWHMDFHENVLTTPEVSLHSEYTFAAELWPSEDDGCSRVEIVDRHIDFEFSGDLSFLSSDGSLICTQPVILNITGHYDEIPGPKFADVVTLIRKNESSFKDLLTLRFQFRNYSGFEFVTLTTTINARKVSLTIDHKLIGNFLPNDPEPIYTDRNVILKAIRKDKTVEFIVKRNDKLEDFLLVKAFIRMISSDNTLIKKKEEVWHVFKKTKTTQGNNQESEPTWTFSKLKAEVIRERRITVILRLEIIDSEMLEWFYSNLVPESRVDLVSSPKKISSTSIFSENSVGMLAKDFMCLYQDQDHSDLTLKCGKASFPVHRAILCARSPVFKTMLSSDMKEKGSSEVVIEDLDTSTLARFLGFLYSGSVEDLQCDGALKLYYAADKYQVPTLKGECTDVLCGDLSVSNVCDVLSLADRHQDQALVKTCRCFILDNYNVVLQSREWESFIEREPLLGVKTVTYFAAKNCVVKNKLSSS